MAKTATKKKPTKGAVEITSSGGYTTKEIPLIPEGAPAVATAAAKFKVGDQVRSIKSGLTGIVEVVHRPRAMSNDEYFYNMAGEVHFTAVESDLETVDLLNPAVGHLTQGPQLKDSAEPVVKTALSPATELPVNSIVPHPKNRKVNGSDPRFLELVESIRQVGVLEPVLVRPMGSFYELMGGGRRWNAAIAAGLETIPAIVRELDDRQALEVRIHENMHRVDLDPIQEARTLQEMLESGYTPADAAARLGKSPSWMATRARLAELIPEWMDAFQGVVELPQGGGVVIKIDLSGWAVRSMELIARLPRETQRSIWEKHVRDADGWELGSLPDCRADDVEEMIEGFTLLLKDAAWNKAKKLGDLAPCKGCPRSSQAQPDLFEGEEPKDNRCLDPACWAKKERIHAEELVVQAQAEHGEVLLLSKHYETKTEGLVACKNWNQVSKESNGARPAVIVEGGKPEVVFVRLGNGARTNGNSEPIQKTVAMKKAQHDKLRRSILLELILEELPCAMTRLIENCETVDDEQKFHHTMLSLVLAFGTEHRDLSTYYSDGWAKAGALRADHPGELWSALADSVENVLKRRLEDAGKSDEPCMHEAFQVCTLLSIDIDGLYEMACERKPYPKTWAKEAEQIETPPLASFVKERCRPDYGSGYTGGVENGDEADEDEDPDLVSEEEEEE